MAINGERPTVDRAVNDALRMLPEVGGSCVLVRDADDAPTGKWYAAVPVQDVWRGDEPELNDWLILYTFLEGRIDRVPLNPPLPR
jgi:hypothetical protein